MKKLYSHVLGCDVGEFVSIGIMSKEHENFPTGQGQFSSLWTPRNGIPWAKGGPTDPRFRENEHGISIQNRFNSTEATWLHAGEMYIFTGSLALGFKQNASSAT